MARVEKAGGLLMPAPPCRPVEDQRSASGGREQEVSEQATSFGNRERAQASWGIGGKGANGFHHAGQKGQRQHEQGDMAVPASEAADLVVVQSQFFAVFNILFDPPAIVQGTDLGEKRGERGREDDVKGWIVAGIGRTPDEQAVPAIVLPAMPGGQVSPIKETRTFGSLAHGKARPRRGSQQSGYLAHFQSAYSDSGKVQDNRFGGGNGQHVLLLLGLQPTAQLRVAPIDGVSGDPLWADTGLFEALQHQDGQLGFGAKRACRRDMGAGAPSRVIGPFPWQIQLSINERMARFCDQREEDADLTIAHVTSRSTILFADTSRVFASFGKAGFIDGDDQVSGSHVFQREGADLIAHPISVPDGLGK